MADGAAYSLMVGVGETYVPAFVLALGLGAIAAGLVATLPIVAGAVLQLATPWAVARLGSHRRWVVACAAVQATSLLLLVAIALSAPAAAWPVFAAATLYWSSSLATGPAWNAWIEGLVPKRMRPRFFASRVRVCQVAVLIGFVLGGFVLQASNATSYIMYAFAGLFTAAAVCRFVSAAFLARQSEPAETAKLPQVGLRQLLRRVERGPGSVLLVYLLLVQGAVYVAAPFFTPYMLNELNFSYLQFMALTSIAVTAKALAMPYIGRLAQRLGGHRLLCIGGLAIVPLSALWVISHSFWYLACVQFVSGLAWATYELAMFLMFFEALPRERRVSLLTLYNLGNAAAMLCGSLLGALLLKLAGPGWTSYLILFGVSSLGRLTTVVLLGRIHEVSVPVVRAARRTLAVRPSAGTVDQPILSSIANGESRSLPNLDGKDVTQAEPLTLRSPPLPVAELSDAHRALAPPHSKFGLIAADREGPSPREGGDRGLSTAGAAMKTRSETTEGTEKEFQVES